MRRGRKTRSPEEREGGWAGYPDAVKRRGRVRRVTKWAGLVVCVLIAAAWCVSIRWGLGYQGVAPSEYVWRVTDGGLVLSYWELRPGSNQWQFAVNHPQSKWRPEWESFSSAAGHCWWFQLPLWMPLSLVALPTGWLLWRDWRRPRPGHCACGYDLAGLAPGAACPECGKADS